MQKFEASKMEVTAPLTVERMGVAFDVKISEAQGNAKGTVIISLFRGDKEACYFSVRKNSVNASKGADFYKLSKHEQKQAENISISDKITIVDAPETPLTEEQKKRREQEDYARKNLDFSRSEIREMSDAELWQRVQHDL